MKIGLSLNTFYSVVILPYNVQLLSVLFSRSEDSDLIIKL